MESFARLQCTSASLVLDDGIFYQQLVAGADLEVVESISEIEGILTVGTDHASLVTLAETNFTCERKTKDSKDVATQVGYRPAQ